jgi:hypothetical protein
VRLALLRLLRRSPCITFLPTTRWATFPQTMLGSGRNDRIGHMAHLADLIADLTARRGSSTDVPTLSEERGRLPAASSKPSPVVSPRRCGSGTLLNLTGAGWSAPERPRSFWVPPPRRRTRCWGPRGSADARCSPIFALFALLGRPEKPKRPVETGGQFHLWTPTQDATGASGVYRASKLLPEFGRAVLRRKVFA